MSSSYTMEVCPCCETKTSNGAEAKEQHFSVIKELTRVSEKHRDSIGLIKAGRAWMELVHTGVTNSERPNTLCYSHERAYLSFAADCFTLASEIENEQTKKERLAKKQKESSK